MRNRFASISLALLAVSVIALGGCTWVKTNIFASKSTPQTNNAALAPEVSSSPVAMYGDRPADQPAPFDRRLTTNLQQHSFTSEGFDFDPDVDPTGDVLVFASTRNAQQPDIYLKRVGGTSLTQLTGDPSADVQPHFSPNGERVAFASSRTGNWDIWVINRDGTGLMQLTHDLTDEVGPTWSPDGQQIAYCAWGQRSGQWEIWTLDVEKPGLRNFVAYGMFPSWSPGGDKLAFQRSRKRAGEWYNVWTVDLVDGEARHPTEIAHDADRACISPRWSPDGSKLVYCTIRPEMAGVAPDGGSPGVAEVWAVDLNTENRVQLSDDVSSAFNPVWGPNNRIYFVSARTGTENIWSLGANMRAIVAAGTGSSGTHASTNTETPPQGK